MADTAAAPSDARQALVEAAKAMLPDRPPSTVTGRELAEAAGVNYGLVHHYFGGKDAVLREALLELRAEFVAEQSDLGMPELIRTSTPFVRAVGRSQTDYPDSLGPVDEFPLGQAMVDGIRRRMVDTDAASAPDAETRAKARAAALMCLQLGHHLYRELLHATVGAADDPEAVDDAFADLYREIALVSPTPG